MALDKNKVTAEATKLVQKGQYDKAIRAYEKVLAEDPKDVRFLLKIGELQQKKGDNRAAAETFGRVADAYGEQGFFLKAVAVYKQMMRLAPEDVRVNERLAALYQQLGLLSEAMAQLHAIATAAEKGGDDAKLLEVLRRMVDLDPENVGSAIKLGELYARQSKLPLALQQLRRAGDQLKRAGRTDEYVKVAERMTFLAPEDNQLRRELAAILLAQGDTKRALAKLQLCFKHDPKDVATLDLLAQAFQDLGQVSKMISVFKELAQVHAGAGRAEESRAAWRRVMELAPGDPDASSALARPSRAPAVGGTREVTPPPLGVSAPPLAPEPTRIVEGPARPAPPPLPPTSPGRAAPPESVAGPDAIPKLLTETDVYVKYGLHDKALEHLQRVFAIDPDHLEGREKAMRLRAQRGDGPGAAEEAARVARIALARQLDDRAQAALARLRELAPDHPALAELSVAPAPGRPGDALGAPEATDDGLVLEIEESPPAAGDDLALAAATGEGEELVLEDPVEGPVVEERGAELPEVAEGGGEGSEHLRDAEAGRGLEAAPAGSVEPATPGDSEAIAPRELEAEPGGQDATLSGSATSPEAADGEPSAQVEAAAGASAEAGADAEPPPVATETAPETAPEALGEELAEVDFFLQQGLLDEARDLLDDLLAAHPEHPRLTAKLEELERALADAAREESPSAPAPQVASSPGPAPAEAPSRTPPPAAVRPPAPSAADYLYTAEDVFGRFKQQIAQTVQPEDAATHYDLGIAYREMGLLEDALREFEIALSGGGAAKEVDGLAMIGLCRLEKGDAAGAVDAYRRALSAGPSRPEAVRDLEYQLAQAYAAAGDPEAALYYLHRVMERDGAYRDARAMVERLGGGPGRAPA